MTIQISSVNFTSVPRLLFRWKGSIWKSIWPEVLIWMILYTILSLIYRFLLTESQSEFFEGIIVYVYSFAEYIPLNFMLGFYVTAVFGRWTNFLRNIAWIDTPALFIAANVHGNDKVARKTRKSLVRYLVLTQALIFQTISMHVKRRFPKMVDLMIAGLMTKDELSAFNGVESPHAKYWLPVEWANQLLRKARAQKLIDTDVVYIHMMEKFSKFRSSTTNLVMYDWISIPIIYTQVVNLSVRCYFLCNLIGRQYLKHDHEIPLEKLVNVAPLKIDLYVPIMTIFQLIFYLGWMKAAEVMLNPFGEDDDDFECNYIINRNLEVGMLIVDGRYGSLPDSDDNDSGNYVYTTVEETVNQNNFEETCSKL